MHFTIRYRLLIFSLAIILTGAALTAGTTIYFQLRALEASHHHFGKEFAEITGKHAIPALRAGDVEQLNRLLEPIIHEPDFVENIFISLEGVVIAGGDDKVFTNHSRPEAVLPYVKTLSSTNKTNYWEHNGNIAITRRVADKSGEVVGYFHLELSREDIEEETHQITLRLLPVGLLLILFSYLAASRLAHYFHAPLRAAASVANEVAAGNYVVDSEKQAVRNDEFGELTTALNTMAGRISSTIDELNDVKLELEEMFSVMVDGVIVVDTAGTIQRVNQRMVQLTGAKSESLIGKSLISLFSGETVIENLHGVGVEKKLRGHDDELIAVQVSGALIHPQQKEEPIGSVLLVHDLSDRVRAERQEQYAAFQAGVADMGASVLHNIGNVVTGMSGHLIKSRKYISSLTKYTKPLNKFADINEEILRNPDTPDAVEKRLQESSELLRGVSRALDSFMEKASTIEKIDHGIRHIGEVISIQNSASRPIITASWFEVGPFVEDTLSLIEDRFRKYDVHYSYEIDSGLKQVHLPRNPLMQLLLNLLKNSLEAVNERDLVEPMEERVVRIKVELMEEEYFLLMVEDNGCGIPHNQLKQIFTARHTTKETGSGYGLHSAMLFVQQVGGEIFAESGGVNQGSRVKAILPLEVSEQDERWHGDQN